MSTDGSGSGKGKEPTMADMSKRLSAIEEVLRSLQLLAERFTALETKVQEQGQQQVALNIALSRVENAISGDRSDDDVDKQPKNKQLFQEKKGRRLQ